MIVTPKCKEGAYWTHNERKEFRGSDLKCFDHHTFYVDYSAINVFCIAIKVATGVWGLAPRNNLHNNIPYNAGKCLFAK